MLNISANEEKITKRNKKPICDLLALLKKKKNLYKTCKIDKLFTEIGMKFYLTFKLACH